MRQVLVWDLPTRIFHWLLAAAVAGLVLSGQIGGNFMDWHGRFGIAVIGLLAFRLVWGLAGPTYARFTQFFPTPGKILAYLRGEWRGLGHNPLGALSVFGLLAVLALQAATGLFANDDIAFNGPLYPLAGKGLSDRLAGIHKLSAKLVYGLVALHIGAIVFYARVKKNNLVRPMLTGRTETDDGEPARGGGPLALAVALALAVGAAWAASGAWIPAPPPAPPPAW